MKVLVTGAHGFIGKNLCVMLGERTDFEVLPVGRESSTAQIADAASRCDAVVHLAGVNRPRNPEDFFLGNVEFSRTLCGFLSRNDRPPTVVFASSVQAASDNPYGRSKRAAERLLESYGSTTQAPVAIYRLPNVFGKWGRPEYNSVVSTFCHNIARDEGIRVDDPAKELRLVYVDDVVASFVGYLQSPGGGVSRPKVHPEYAITIGSLAERIRSFHESRGALSIDRVGVGLERALYSTYISYLPDCRFSYPVASHEDARGTFVEMLKTRDSGQFSYFTAHPGVTRGGHYHHTKTEKFLVIKGKARYRFRELLTGQEIEIESSGNEPLVVDTIPGWSHDITNTGDDELIVMLWANEVFDRNKPDTISSPL